MAHYKRKRARTAPGGHYSANALKHRLGPRWSDRMWLSGWPRYWDKVMHTRPMRARARRLEQAVLNGADPDGLSWPLSRKPHIYYW
jgi:hypothetical protein